MVFAVMSAGAITRSELASYASSLKGKKKGELKTAIYNLCQPTTVLTYGSGTQSTWGGFWSTDRDEETNLCTNRYSSDKFYFSTKGTAIDGMNIEHSFPKSWWGGDKNNGYKDLYNLYPSPSSVNSDKGNYPMCTVTTVTTDDGYTKIGKATIDGSQVTCFEPCDMYKGDFCRGYMYMACIYQDLTWQGDNGLIELTNDTDSDGNPWPTLQKWAYTLYLQWNKDDHVSQLEVDRNNAVNEIQGNRNPFVDFPYLAEYVWGDSIDTAFDPTTALTTADDDTRYTLSTEKEEGGSEVVVTGENIYKKVTSADQLTAGSKYIFVYEGATPYFMGSINTSGTNYGTSVSGPTISDSQVNISGYEIAELTLGGSEGAWTFDMGSDTYLTWQSGNSLTTSTSASSTNAQWVVTESDGSYIAKNASENTRILQYNSNSPRFACYTSSQKTACLYVQMYTSDISAPTFSPEAGTYTEAQEVEISCTTDGVTIYYTTDGTTPDATGGTVYTGAITVSETTTLRAIAIDADGNESSVATAVYTIETKEEEETGSGDYVLITSTDDIEDGADYLIVYESGTLIFDGSLTSLDATNNYQSVTITDHTITAAEGDPYKFVITKSGDNYVIQSKSGYYIGQTADSNGLDTHTSTEYTNTISFDSDGNADIIGSGGAYLRFNNTSNQMRFRYYQTKSYTGQKAIQLYKKSASSAETVEVTIGTTGFATLYYGEKNLIVPDGVTATAYAIVDNSLTETKVYQAGDVIPAGTGVLLYDGLSTEVNYAFTVTDETGEEPEANMLYGTDTEQTITEPEGDYLYYKLTTSKGKNVGFYYGASGGGAFTNGAHKAYLAVPASDAAKAVYLLQGEETGVSGVTVTDDAAGTAVYDLQGRRVTRPVKGIYIRDGRKYVVK